MSFRVVFFCFWFFGLFLAFVFLLWCSGHYLLKFLLCCRSSKMEAIFFYSSWYLRPGGAVLFCWKPPATTWAQVIGASFSVPFFRHNVKSLRVWEACFVADTHAMKSLRVWEACFVADTHAMKSLRVWEACFVADTHTMKSLRVWEACFVADTHAMKSLKVWEACFVADTHVMKSLWVWETCFVADTHAMKSLRVWEACFVADTHAMESLRVWEAYSIADTQIVKTGRYNKGYVLKCSSYMFCIWGLYRKTGLWDTKFAINNA